MPLAIASVVVGGEALDQALEEVGLEADVGVDLDDDVDRLGERAGAAQEAVEVAGTAAAVGERLVAVGAVARSGRTQACSAASSASTSAVPSVEPSSTTTQATGSVRLRGQRRAEAPEVVLLVARRA